MSQTLKELPPSVYKNSELLETLKSSGAVLPPELLSQMRVVEAAAQVAEELKAGREPLASEVALSKQLNNQRGRAKELARALGHDLAPQPQRDAPER